MQGALVRARLCVAAVALAVVLTGCGGGSGTASETGGTTATSDPPRTEGTDVTFSGPSTAAPPTAAPSTTTTTTTAAVGLPPTFPVPENGIYTLGGSSTITQSIEILGVPPAEVHDWLVDGIVAGGYAITSDTAEAVAFIGDGLAGEAEVISEPEAITVVIRLHSPDAVRR